jgi:hypothetical protein
MASKGRSVSWGGVCFLPVRREILEYNLNEFKLTKELKFSKPAKSFKETEFGAFKTREYNLAHGI